MVHVYWMFVSFLALCIGFRMGWNQGLDDTLAHFQKNPIPEEWIERR